MKTFTGSCHCGAVRFEITSDFPELTTCNCSICRRNNALMVKVHESQFKLYQSHTFTAKHYFCNVCGIYPFHRKRVTPDFLGITCSALKALIHQASQFGQPMVRACHDERGASVQQGDRLCENYFDIRHEQGL